MSFRSSAIEVSVVVPAYNQAVFLVRLLDSLAAQENAPAWEVIIVDDASTDSTRPDTELWLTNHPEIRGRYMRQEHNRGPGAARNGGLAVAKGRLVAFTDTDCVAEPGWLNGLVRAFERDKSVAGVGGRVVAHDDQNVFARYNSLNGTLEPHDAPDDAIPYLVTCNCCYRRDLLEAAGGFPEYISTPGGEDVAASIALYKSGHRFTYAADAVIRHDYRDTLRSFARTWRNYGYGCGLITHQRLSPEELNPEWGKWDGDNYWSVQAVRPTVTGVRSLWKDLRWFRERCRKTTGHGRIVPAQLLLRIIDRLCYLRGWIAGVRAAAGRENVH